MSNFILPIRSFQNSSIMLPSHLLSFNQDFFHYNHQINLKLSNSFNSNLDLLSPKIIRLACHILNAHCLWNSRLEGLADACKPWDLFPLELFAEKDEQNYLTTLKILEKIDFDERIVYTNSMGIKYESINKDILTHMVNHSTYHRAQIAMLMRESGLEPVPSDFIHFKSKVL